MEVYVLVKVFQALVDGVEVFWDEKQAEKHFKEYTGVSYAEYEKRQTPGIGYTNIDKPEKDIQITVPISLGKFEDTQIFVCNLDLKQAITMLKDTQPAALQEIINLINSFFG